MLVVCKCGTGGGQFARKSTFSRLLALMHHKPVTAMPVFSSDAEQYKIIM